MTPAQAREITRSRFQEWEDELVTQHSTPALLISIGHDHKSGQIMISVPDDLSDEDIAHFLTFATKAMATPGRPAIRHL